MTPEAETPEILYGMDEPDVMIPHEWCATASQARYRGWKELDDVQMIDGPFDPRRVHVRVRWMFRYTASPWAELTHRFGDAMTPGAYKVWWIRVEPFASAPLV